MQLNTGVGSAGGGGVSQELSVMYNMGGGGGANDL